MRLKIRKIYHAAGPLGVMLLLTGCAPDIPYSEEMSSSEVVYLLPEETWELELPQTAEISEAAPDSNLQENRVTPQEALTEVFNRLYSGSQWSETAVLHSENPEHPYYMGEILHASDDRVITDKKLIAEFWTVYPQMSQARETAEDDSWREQFHFGCITGQENWYLEYSGLAANENTYIFRLYTREWPDIYSKEVKETLQNFYAFVVESGDIVPMYLYRGTKNDKFNERYGEVTSKY